MGDEHEEFAAELLNAIETAYREERKATVVHSIELVEALSMYGYSRNPEKRLRISLVSPSLVAPVARMLGAGCFFEHEFRVFEASLDPTAQFRADCAPSDLILIACPALTPPEECSVGDILNFRMQEKVASLRLRAQEKTEPGLSAMLPVAVPKVLRLEELLAGAVVQGIDTSDSVLDIITSPEALLACIDIVWKQLRHGEAQNRALALISSMLSSAPVLGSLLTAELMDSATKPSGFLREVFGMSPGADGILMISTDEDTREAVSAVLCRPRGEEKAAPWRSRGSVDPQRVAVVKGAAATTVAQKDRCEQWDSVEWQEKQLVRAAREAKEIFDLR